MKISEYIQHFNSQLEIPFDFIYRSSAQGICITQVGHFLLATTKTPFYLNLCYTDVGELRPWIACKIRKNDITLEQDVANINALAEVLNSQLDTYKVLFL